MSGRWFCSRHRVTAATSASVLEGEAIKGMSVGGNGGQFQPASVFRAKYGLTSAHTDVPGGTAGVRSVGMSRVPGYHWHNTVQCSFTNVTV